MKYYQLSHNTNIKEVGIIDQIQELTVPYTKKIIDWFGSLELSKKFFLEPMPPLDKFKLSDLADFTDILSFKYFSTNIGFLHNSKVRDILDDCIAYNYKYYNAIIHLGLTQTPYFLFYLTEGNSYINFSKSEFYKTNFLGMKKGDPISVNSYKDYQKQNHNIQLEKPGALLSFTKVCLNEKVDIIRLPGNSRIFISANLKDRLEKNKITGLMYLPLRLEFEIKS